MELQGRVLSDQYRIDHHLATGGMATVYAGTDLRLDAAIAIKVLTAHYAGVEEARERLIREAQILARLDHPNICGVLNMIVEGDLVAIVLDRIEGITLEKYARDQGRLDLPTLWNLMNPVMDAVAFAHSEDIVHRDLKPSNVMLKQWGGQLIPVVLDFGIAKHLGPHLRSDIHTRAPIGTPAYMAPEQVDNDRIDWRADIYALGAMLHRLATGSLPYEGTTGRVYHQILSNAPPPPPSSLVPSLPRAFDDCVACAMAADRADRWQNVDALRRRLHEVVRQAHPLADLGTGPYPKTIRMTPASGSPAVNLPPSVPPRSAELGETSGGWLASPPSVPPSVEAVPVSAPSPGPTVSAPPRPVADPVPRSMPGRPVRPPAPPPRGRQKRQRRLWPLLAGLVLLGLGGGLVAWQSFAGVGCADDRACSTDAVCDGGECVERLASADAFYRGVISAYNARDQGAYLAAWAERVDCFWRLDQTWTRAEIGAKRSVQFTEGGYHIDIERLDGRAMPTGVVRLSERGRHGHASGESRVVERELALARRGGRWVLVGEAAVGAACLPR